MTAKGKIKYLNAHRGCPGGPKCWHCTWDSLHISVDGPHAKYIKGHQRSSKVIAGNIATLTVRLTIF